MMDTLDHTTSANDAIDFHGDLLEFELAPGETAFVRRSSLVFAEGAFELKTGRIAKRRFNIVAIFSGQVRWANSFKAKDGPVHLMAGRDFVGTVISLTVTPQRAVHIKPGLYLGHKGDLSFNTRRVAKKEFWTLNEVTGTGTVYIKLPGKPLVKAMSPDAHIVDTNYVAAISGTFEAHGKVFSSKEVLKSGELENVKLTGDGVVLFQSENPADASSGGGILQTILDILPF